MGHKSGGHGENCLSCNFCGKSDKEVAKLIAGPQVFICDECIEVCTDIVRESAKTDAGVRLRERLPTPREIAAQLSEYVIGQDDAKETLALAVYNHYKRLAAGAGPGGVEIRKSNILLLGPTGTGKTYLAETLARTLGVPIAIADATELTAAGYVGADVESVLAKLLASADGDVEKAQRGIIYIDEIDKIARKGENMSITRDVGGESVQQALLKMLEGKVAEVPSGGGRKHPQAEMVKIDTKNILFICGGAFADLHKIIAARTAKQGGSIGFTASAVGKAEDARDVGDLLKAVTPDDLVKAGMIPELLGRLPVITSTENLDEAALIKILTEPKNAIVKEFQALAAMEGVTLTFQPEALAAIAQKAVERGTGARGLRTIVEKTLKATLYDLPDRPDVSEVVISAEVVNSDGKAKPLYILKDEAQTQRARIGKETRLQAT